MNSAYEQHFEYMKDIINVEDVKDEDLEPQFNLLLSCLPNKGKLYKYRSFSNKSFEKVYNSLECGYMWFAAADTLNDDNDSLLFQDAEHATCRFADVLFEDHFSVIHMLVRLFGFKYWNADNKLRGIPFEILLRCFDFAAASQGQDKRDVLMSQVKKAQIPIDSLLGLFERVLKDDCKKILRKNIDNWFKANSTVRKNMHIFSFSARYDLNNMWGYYADSGRGFCIEYDYNLAKRNDKESIRRLLHTFKVEYLNTPRQFPVELIAKWMLPQENSLQLEHDLKLALLKQMLWKDICWEHEQEWRVALGIIDSRVSIDIVSGIIIDERSANQPNAQKLIRLSKKRGWSIVVRKNCAYAASHKYEKLSE